MRLGRSVGAGRVVTVLLTLSLLAISQQQVKADHIILYAAGFAAIGAAAGAAVWLIMRNGDDPPDPSTQDSPTASHSTPWRPLPAMVQVAFEKQFGTVPTRNSYREHQPLSAVPIARPNARSLPAGVCGNWMTARGGLALAAEPIRETLSHSLAGSPNRRR